MNGIDNIKKELGILEMEDLGLVMVNGKYARVSRIKQQIGKRAITHYSAAPEDVTPRERYDWDIRIVREVRNAGA